MQPADADRQRLLAVKLAHTAIWAVFAGAVVGIPVATFVGDIRLGLWLSVLVWVEVAILLVNRMSCPLTAVAGRYTPNRAANFDIFLPEWLAANNKLIFGWLFAAGEVYWLLRWLGIG